MDEPAQPENLPSTPTQDSILPLTRVMGALVVPVLLAAFIMLYILTPDSGRLFAWPIAPTMNAMMLGATYMGGAYFFTWVVFSKRWHTVRLGVLPTAAFAAVMGIATILHWDKFSHGTLAVNLWVLLYFVLPFVIPVVWYINERANRNDPPSTEPQFNRTLRLVIGLIGGVLTLVSLVLLVAPQSMIGIWPWKLTALTARAMSAMYLLPGLVGLSVAKNGRWSSAKIIFQAQVVAVGLILLAMLRAGGEIAWNQWGAWGIAGGMLLVVGLIGLAWGDARRRAK